MKKFRLLVLSTFLTFAAIAQENMYLNTADNLLSQDSKLIIGGYGEVHYNQALKSGMAQNGKLDVHRMVLLFGYNFDEKTQFISELEFEHVKEVYVEQAFLQHKINSFINLRAGLMLVPMGITNEYHEPTTFNGVERPLIDTYLTPTTWREIGLGVTGNILPSSVKYQAYLLNGFNGYNGEAKFSGKSGFRSGRQKGAESYISSPNLTGKIEYYGIRGLNVGVSGYLGKSQSTSYHGIDKSDATAIATADSSIVGIQMLGIDSRYSLKGLQLKGQFYYANVTNTEAYNVFTANDLGSGMLGYYLEAGYNVLRSFNTSKQLVPFVRYEYLNTHQKVATNIAKNASYARNLITTGITLELVKGAVVKFDLQLAKDGSSNEFSKSVNAGIGIMF